MGLQEWIKSFVFAIVIPPILHIFSVAISALLAKYYPEKRMYLWHFGLLIINYSILTLIVLIVNNGKQQHKKEELQAADVSAFLTFVIIVLFLSRSILPIIAPVDNSLKEILSALKINQSLTIMPVLLLMVIRIMVIPAVEELYFRKMLFSIPERFNIESLLVGAIGFSFYHYWRHQIITTLLGGLVLGFIYQRTKNIRLNIVLHMLINALIELRIRI